MKVLEILNKTEKELREAIAESARSGDYRAVEVGRSVAVNIKELCERISRNGQLTTMPASIAKGNDEKSQKKKITRRNKPSGLPRFEVRNGSLFKIGWSKKQHSEYSHKVPRSAYDAIANSMTKLVNEGTGPFTAETVIEKLNASIEDTIPAYQVYVVLAAFRSLDAISQIGREGYDIPIDISEKAKDLWKEMACN